MMQQQYIQLTVNKLMKRYNNRNIVKMWIKWIKSWYQYNRIRMKIVLCECFDQMNGENRNWNISYTIKKIT